MRSLTYRSIIPSRFADEVEARTTRDRDDDDDDGAARTIGTTPFEEEA